MSEDENLGRAFCPNPINGPNEKFLVFFVGGVVEMMTRDKARADDRIIEASYQKWGGMSAPRVLGAFLFGAPVGRVLYISPRIVLVRTDDDVEIS